MEKLARGIAWLDTGTQESLAQTSNYGGDSRRRHRRTGCAPGRPRLFRRDLPRRLRTRLLCAHAHRVGGVQVHRRYDPGGEIGVAWNDPTLGISWPVIDPVQKSIEEYPRQLSE